MDLHQIKEIELKNMAKERIENYDTFRGIGINLMVMGHVYFGNAFDHFIHGFHMPMFFYISGYFTNLL